MNLENYIWCINIGVGYINRKDSLMTISIKNHIKNHFTHFVFHRDVPRLTQIYLTRVYLNLHFYRQNKSFEQKLKPLCKWKILVEFFRTATWNEWQLSQELVSNAGLARAKRLFYSLTGIIQVFNGGGATIPTIVGLNTRLLFYTYCYMLFILNFIWRT